MSIMSHQEIEKSNRMAFNFERITRVEFYVCLSEEGNERHYQVPVDQSVQGALKEMISTTVQRIADCKNAGDFEEFSPAQKYGPTDAVYCALDSDFAEMPRLLLEEAQIPETRHALEDLQKISYYYIIGFDPSGNKILGVRRATQFKGVLKAKLLTIVDNTMKLLPETTFRLDADFDYLVFDEMLWALRPAGLEFTANLTAAVKAAAPASAQEVVRRVPFLNLTALGTYASKHPRAARYLAAVKARGDLEDLSQKLLIRYCKESSVELVKAGGKLSPAEGFEILFLEVLDRRIFTAHLIEGRKERYEAPNRRNV